MGSSAETCWKQVWRHGQRPGAGRREQKKTNVWIYSFAHCCVNPALELFVPPRGTSGNMQHADCVFVSAVLSSHSRRLQHGHQANRPHAATKWAKRCGSHPSSRYSFITDTHLLFAQLLRPIRGHYTTNKDAHPLIFLLLSQGALVMPSPWWGLMCTCLMTADTRGLKPWTGLTTTLFWTPAVCWSLWSTTNSSSQSTQSSELEEETLRLVISRGTFLPANYK